MHFQDPNALRKGRKIDPGPKKKLEVQMQCLIERVETVEDLVSRVARLEAALQHLSEPKRGPGRPKRVA